MTPLAVPVLPGPITATWRVPGSKSITNRALILAALAEGTVILENVLEADDTRYMRRCLEQLGISVRDGAPGQLIVTGGRARLRPSAEPLFVGNSGTTVRFLAALCCLVPGPTTLVGDQAMAKRPIADLVDGLRQLGVTVDCATGCPPLTIHGGRMPGGTVRMRGDRSSQYFSALLLVAGLAQDEVRVVIDGTLVSRPYVDMTRRMVADFGGRVDADASGFTVRRAGGYRPRSYHVEPDASAASYPFALAAAGGHGITVPGLSAESLQGDYAFAEVLASLGATVERTPHHTTVRGSGQLRGGEIDLHHLSDTVMTLAAIAPLASGPTTITNIANIRLKETDRLMATVTELRRLGVTVEHGDDWLRVHPGAISPAAIECYHDHRMAMAFAVLGAITGGVTITDPACTAKTYPDYFHDLRALYGTEHWR